MNGLLLYANPVWDEDIYDWVYNDPPTLIPWAQRDGVFLMNKDTVEVHGIWYAPITGAYEFRYSVNDDLQVYIDDIAVVEDQNGYANTGTGATQEFTAGPHTLRIRYQNTIGDGENDRGFGFWWKCAGSPDVPTDPPLGDLSWTAQYFFPTLADVVPPSSAPSTPESSIIVRITKPLHQVTAPSASEALNTQSITREGFVQVQITGTASVDIEGRVSPDAPWVVMETLTSSELKWIALPNQLRLNVTAVSGSVNAWVHA